MVEEGETQKEFAEELSYPRIEGFIVRDDLSVLSKDLRFVLFPHPYD